MLIREGVFIRRNTVQLQIRRDKRDKVGMIFHITLFLPLL